MGRPQKLAGYSDFALRGALYLLALSAPLSIAATQTAWALALLFWIIRAVSSPVRRPKLSAFDLALIAFVGLTIFSSFFSYEPEVSVRKLVAVSLVTIVYLVSGNIATAKMLRRMATLVVLSGTVAALFALGTFVFGKNLKVVRLLPDSPLRIAGVLDNDTILTVNGRNVSSPSQIAAAVTNSPESGAAHLKVYRVENVFDYEMPVLPAADGVDNVAQLGIAEWSRGRDTRATGFFGHYTTYAEAVQLILSLALALLIVAPGHLFSRKRMILAAVAAVSCGALFLTVTRASWGGFLVSAAVMILIGTSRKTILICVLVAVPVAIAGMLYLQQKRNVAFFDTNDASTTWRTTVWREGVGVLTLNARHLTVGIGMDSLKTHWSDWHMFDNGNLPLGHMHSTPLQIALERGVPALAAWILWMFFYLRMLWRKFSSGGHDWVERGLLLGAFGGAVGFITGGLVHYNWGDSEVIMIFYLLMGLSLAVGVRSSNSAPVTLPA